MKSSYEANAEPDVVPEGTFEAALSDPQIATIKKSIAFGLELQNLHPDLAEDYRSGLSLEAILKKHNLDTTKDAVRHALRGYDGRMKSFSDVAVYPGLISEEEYDAIAAGRHKESGQRQFEEGAGIHAQTKDEIREIGKSGALEQGSMPYEKVEMETIQELAGMPEYQRQSRINAKMIAAELNRRLHKGEAVRTPRQVVKMFYMLKKRKED